MTVGQAVGAARRGVFDRRHENVRFRMRERQADASLVAGRNAILELLPRDAGVRALVNGAAGTAAVETKRLAEPLVRRRVEHSRVARVHYEIGRAGERIHVEHLRPGAAGVRRLEDAALRVPGPEVPNRRDERHVRVGGVEHDAADGAGVVEAQIRPGVAAVRRAVHTAAPRGALPIVVFAGASPDDLRIALENRQRPERIVGLPAEHVLPGDTVVDRLPDAAGRGAYVQNGGVFRIDLDVVDASAAGRWTDVAEVQRVERPSGGPFRLSLRACGREGGERCKSNEGNECRETGCVAHDGRSVCEGPRHLQHKVQRRFIVAAA